MPKVDVFHKFNNQNLSLCLTVWEAAPLRTTLSIDNDLPRIRTQFRRNHLRLGAHLPTNRPPGTTLARRFTAVVEMLAVVVCAAFVCTRLSWKGRRRSDLKYLKSLWFGWEKCVEKTTKIILKTKKKWNMDFCRIFFLRGKKEQFFYL